MSQPDYPEYPTQYGYLTEKTRQEYIALAVEAGALPEGAHRLAGVVSLTAPGDPAVPVQFWQLYSMLGQDRIVAVVAAFYQRVFDDEEWFRSVFARVGGLNHHIGTQASMWIDVMGGGPYYHGGAFRLSFHHTHNAHQLMDARGARRWVSLMVAALDATVPYVTDDPRVRPSFNTFLTHFFAKYADEFGFENAETFGETNPVWVP